MKKDYEIVNPYIVGNFDKKITSSNVKKAAHKAYKQISNYFVNNTPLPLFCFTLKSDDNLYHFKASEKSSKKGINYEIVPYNDVSKTKENQFKSLLSSMSGGNFDEFFDTEDDSSSSSSSDEDDTFDLDGTKIKYGIPMRTDITKFWYTPVIYPISSKQLYIPIFDNVITPIVKLNLELSKYPL